MNASTALTFLSYHVNLCLKSLVDVYQKGFNLEKTWTILRRNPFGGMLRGPSPAADQSKNGCEYNRTGAEDGDDLL